MRDGTLGGSTTGLESVKLEKELQGDGVDTSGGRVFMLALVEFSSEEKVNFSQ